MPKSRKSNYSQFKKIVRKKRDAISTIIFLEPIATRIAYLIYKYDLPISPNSITSLRLIFIFPLILGFLIYNIFKPSLNLFGVVSLLFYIGLITDVVDGEVARGKKLATKKGMVLDGIADRFGAVIFFFFILSISFLLKDIYLRIIAYLLIILKILNLNSTMMLQHIRNETNRIDSEVFRLKFFKGFLKRWDGRITIFEFYFTGVIIPGIFVFLRFFLISKLFLYLTAVVFLLYYSYSIYNNFSRVVSIED